MSLVISLAFNSCGIFLQKTGTKNYIPKIKITEKGLTKYQYDFVYLSKLLNEGFPNIDSVFPEYHRKNLEKQILVRLSEPDLENIDFEIQSRKYLSNLKNQHTYLHLTSEYKSVYPFAIHISRDSWYLINIEQGFDSLLLGEKITKINGVNTGEIEERLIEYCFSENKINQQYEIRDKQFYNKPRFLREIDIIENLSESIKLTLENSSEIELFPKSADQEIETNKIDFSNNPISEQKDETYFYRLYPNQDFGYLQFNKCHDKIDILEGIENYVKPWLQPLARAYVKRQFKKGKPSKQIAPFYNPKHPIFRDFIWELVEDMNSKQVKNLIIDLRNNPGGNLTLGVQLMYFLTEKENLKGFSNYAYTSEIYKNYFPDEYKNLEKEYPNGVTQNRLVPIEENPNLFQDITDHSSKYYIPKSRPVFNGDIYILSNYRTGSAAALLTTLFQDNKIGKVIGTSVGNNPIGPTAYTPMQLPKTKAKISIATSYAVRPNKSKGKYQIPDYWIEYAVEDLKNARDPSLTKAMELIEEVSQ